MLFCTHDWIPIEEVGIDWDVRVGVVVKCKCSKCNYIKDVPNYILYEVPDELVNKSIRY